MAGKGVTSKMNTTVSKNLPAAIGRFHYVNPQFLQSEELSLPEALPPTDEYMVSSTKTIQNGRNYNFNLRDDKFELLTGISLPLTHEQYADKSACFYAARDVFGPLAVQLLKDRLGLTTCFAWYIIPPFVRKSVVPTPPNNNNNDNDQSGCSLDTRNLELGTIPHTNVHNDYGYGYDKYLQNLQPKDLGRKDLSKAANVIHNYKSAGRIIVLQFWQSAQRPDTVIETDTLALCHPKSVRDSDLVIRPLPTYDNVKSPPNYVILQAKDSPRHEWYYFPQMKTNDECLCWIGYDSSWDRNEMRPCLHTSFQDMNAKLMTTRPRESIECRVILLLDEKIRSKL